MKKIYVTILSAFLILLTNNSFSKDSDISSYQQMQTILASKLSKTLKTDYALYKTTTNLNIICLVEEDMKRYAFRAPLQLKLSEQSRGQANVKFSSVSSKISSLNLDGVPSQPLLKGSAPFGEESLSFVFSINLSASIKYNKGNVPYFTSSGLNILITDKEIEKDKSRPHVYLNQQIPLPVIARVKNFNFETFFKKGSIYPVLSSNSFDTLDGHRARVACVLALQF